AIELARMLPAIDGQGLGITTAKTSSGSQINFLTRESSVVPDAVRTAFRAQQRSQNRTTTAVKDIDNDGQLRSVVATISSNPLRRMQVANLDTLQVGQNWFQNVSATDRNVNGNLARVGERIEWQDVKAVSVGGRKVPLLIKAAGRSDAAKLTVAADVLDNMGNVILPQGTPVTLDANQNLIAVGDVAVTPVTQDPTAAAPIKSVTVNKDLKFAALQAINFDVRNPDQIRPESMVLDISKTPEMVLKATGLDAFPQTAATNAVTGENAVLIRISKQDFDYAIGSMAPQAYATIQNDLVSYINRSPAAQNRSGAFNREEIQTLADNFFNTQLDNGKLNQIEVMSASYLFTPDNIVSDATGRVSVKATASSSGQTQTFGELTARLDATVDRMAVVYDLPTSMTPQGAVKVDRAKLGKSASVQTASTEITSAKLTQSPQTQSPVAAVGSAGSMTVQELEIDESKSEMIEMARRQPESA
ncbi:MAG: hypothetical protein K8I00_10615, partial [Candidatus Omnitrophica bacterium]|nr:hypothetical protein [Candidatus Omnitrophota bacterium]